MDEQQKKSVMPNVAKAGAIMMISLLLSRFLGIGREIVLGVQFGQDLNVDAYRTAFQVPDLLFNLISAGALSQAFIPVFSKYIHTERERDAWRVFSQVVSLTGIFVLTYIVVMWIFAVPVSAALAPGKSPETVQLIAHMSRILVPTQFAFLIGGLLFGTLYARQIFSIPGMGPNIYNIGIIFGGLVISLFIATPIVGLAWGALFGAFIGSFFLPIFVLRKMGAQYSFDPKPSHEGTKEVFRLMAPIIFGLSLPSVFPIITRYFGNFYEVGVVSAMETMNQLMQAPMGVFGQSLAIAALPALSQFFAQGEMGRYRLQLASSLRTTIFFSAPFMAIFFLYSPEIIRAVFEHGKFDPAATERTASALSMAGIGIVAWCMQPVLMRGFFSIHKTVAPVIMGTICTAIYAGSCYVISQQQLPYMYMPLAGSISALLLAVMLLKVISKEIGGLDFVAMSVTLIKALIATTGAGLLLFASRYVLPQSDTAGGRIGHLVMVLFVLVSFGWVYYFIAKALKMPETETLDRAMSKVGGKFKRT
jgi:putative peptidoglycan lipid II flippase